MRFRCSWWINPLFLHLWYTYSYYSLQISCLSLKSVHAFVFQHDVVSYHHYHDWKRQQQQQQQQHPQTNSRIWQYGAVTTISSFQSRSRNVVTRFAQVQRGDARGAAFLAREVAVSRGSSPVLNRVDWRVEPMQAWAIVGANGCGKSTFLKALVGEIALDSGSIILSNQLEIGYLQQSAVSGSNRTIYDEVASAMTKIQKARELYEELQTQVATMTEPDDITLSKLDQAAQQYEAVGGYTQEQEVATVLKGLGFQDIYKRCDELSGGWQMRVALARLLLSKPSLLLLDEPSNHLDANARQWLAQYLKTYNNGAMILVTHDVDLLDSVSHIAEITSGTLLVYKSCTYQQYLTEKQRRAIAAKNEYERNLDKAAQLQAFVDRFGASATKASAAQSRVKQLEKMKREGLLDAPPEAIIQDERFRPSLILPSPPRSIGDMLMELCDASVGYREQPPLVTNVNFAIRRGMKVLIRGPNGVGKSTILHSLRGTLPLKAGTRQENELLRLGVFTQDLAQELDVSARAVDLVTAYARQDDITIRDQDARNVMGRLGLTGEKAVRILGDLSGGEKARVALAMFALKASNVILLDEPSNHLDVECIQALGESLTNWGNDDGAVVVISHDRNFCRLIPFTHVATVAEGKFILEQRGIRPSDWWSHSENSAVSSVSTQRDDSHASHDTTNHSNNHNLADNEALRKQAFNAPKRIAKLESWIQQTEAKIALLDDEMFKFGTNVDKLTELSRQRDEYETKILNWMEEWEQLESLMAVAAAA
jgi:ATP-binding cassette, subfamily F, member 3